MGSGGMGRLDGQAGCEVEGALRVKREGCGRGAVLGERGQWRYRRGRASEGEKDGEGQSELESSPVGDWEGEVGVPEGVVGWGGLLWGRLPE